MSTVTITEAPLTLEELLEVTRGARVELGADAMALIGASGRSWTPPWPAAGRSTG